MHQAGARQRTGTPRIVAELRLGAWIAAVGDMLHDGRRWTQLEQSGPVLEESGQRYRSTVLVAFQQVEDQLAILTHFGEAAASERQAAAAAQRAMDLAKRRYEQGTAIYLDVVTTQAASLAAEHSSVELATRHRTTAVQLVRALGGGLAEEEQKAGPVT